MCHPLLIIPAITAAVQGGLDAKAADDQAESAEAQADAIRKGEIGQLQANAERQLQEDQSADERVTSINLEAERAGSLASLAAGEAGISGNSALRTIRAVEQSRLRGATAVDANAEAVNRQLGRQAQGIRASTSRGILALNPGPGVGAAAASGSLRGLSSGLSLSSGIHSLSS